MKQDRSSLLVILAIGLVIRLAVLLAAPRHGYVWDHFDNVGMGRTAAAAGLLRVYSVSIDELATVHGQIWRNGVFEAVDRRAHLAPNYPPLAVAIFLMQTSVLDAVQRPLTANTFAARVWMASVPIAFEWIMAVAAGALAARLFGERKRRLAVALGWLAPPIFLNSCLWGQVDAFLLAPAVLTVLLLLDHRWTAAGAAVAAAILLKPQGMLLVPIAAFGALLPDEGGRFAWGRSMRRLGAIALSAAAVIAILTLPWTFADGFAWVRRSYVASFLTVFPDTTLYAFNVWYADLLRLDRQPVFALDSTARILGITKDSWGRALFVLACAGFAVLCWRKIRPRPVARTYFAAMLLWSAFMFPTRVHERFALYAIPFILILAIGYKSLRPAILALLVVGVAEQSWHLWMTGPPAGSLMNRNRVETRLARLQAEYDRSTPESPGAGRLSRPTPRDAVASLEADAGAVLPDYIRARRAVRPRETAITLISIAAFLAAVIGRPRRAPPAAGMDT